MKKIKIGLFPFIFISTMASCANPTSSNKLNNNSEIKISPSSFSFVYDLEKKTKSLHQKKLDLSEMKGVYMHPDDENPIQNLIQNHWSNMWMVRSKINKQENDQEIKIFEKFKYKNDICKFNTIAYKPKINPKYFSTYEDFYIDDDKTPDPWDYQHFEFYDRVAFLESDGCGELIQKWAKESNKEEELLLRPRGYRNLKIKIDKHIKIESKISIFSLFDKILSDYDPNKNDKIFQFKQMLSFPSINDAGKIVDFKINTNFSIIGSKAQKDLKNNMKKNVDYYRNSINSTLKNLIKTRNYGQTIFGRNWFNERGYEIHILKPPKGTCSQEYLNMLAKKDNHDWYYNGFYDNYIKAYLKEEVSYQQFNNAFWKHLAYKYFSKKEANELLSYWNRHKVPPIITETEWSNYFDEKRSQNCLFESNNQTEKPVKKHFN